MGRSSVVYVLTPSDAEEGKVPAHRVWGGNMAIRAAIFNEGYNFDTTIVWPDGTTNYKMGSETSFTCKLEKQGYNSFFAPKAKVQHIITEQAMN